jgi:hypothetical protein
MNLDVYMVKSTDSIKDAGPPYFDYTYDYYYYFIFDYFYYSIWLIDYDGKMIKNLRARLSCGLQNKILQKVKTLKTIFLKEC